MESADAGHDKVITDSSLDLRSGGLANVEDAQLAEFADHHGGAFVFGDWNAYHLTGNDLNNRLTGNNEDNQLAGEAGSDRLDGGTGADTLDGGSGADTMIGGWDDDTYYVDDDGDVVADELRNAQGELVIAGSGYDQVFATASVILGLGIEAATLQGTGNIDATGNDSANQLTGNAGDNRLDGGAGSDTLQGGLGNDTYVTDTLSDQILELSDQGTDTLETWVNRTNWLPNGIENLVLLGTATQGTGGFEANLIIVGGSQAYSYLRGLEGNDTLLGAAGDDWLQGDAGSDLMQGGAGNDRYEVNVAGDVVVELANEGVDLIVSSMSLTTLPAHVENLTLTWWSASRGNGNELSNRLIGSTGADTLYGYAGDDTLDGAENNDSMVGGPGNDAYFVWDAGDVVLELDGEGVDTVHSGSNYTLGTAQENLVTWGREGTGNELANVIDGTGYDAQTLRGLGGDDTLRGGEGGDTLIGGAGNDRYEVVLVDEDSNVVVLEQPGEGDDAVVLTEAPFDLMSAQYRQFEGDLETIDATGILNELYLIAGDAANQITASFGPSTIDAGGGDDRVLADTVPEAGAWTLVYDFMAGWFDEFAFGLQESMEANPASADWDLLKRYAGIVEELPAGADPADYVAVPLTQEVDGVARQGVAWWPLATWHEGGSHGRWPMWHSSGWSRGGNELHVDGAGAVTATGDEAMVEALAQWREGFGPYLEQLMDDWGLVPVIDPAVAPADGHLRIASASWPGGWGLVPIFDWPLDRMPAELVEISAELLAEAGVDFVDAGAGHDYVDGGHGSDVLLGGDGNDTLLGGQAAVLRVVSSMLDPWDGAVGTAVEVAGATQEDDFLDGGAGIDRLAGGVGNDWYVVDGVATPNPDGGSAALNLCDAQHRFGVDRAPADAWVTDTVVEAAGEGSDTVEAAASVDLSAADVELVELTGDGPILDIDAKTGPGSQELVGNDGANRLDGGAGADLMDGGLGDDSYVVDAQDEIVEEADAGFDTIRTELDGYVLGENFEGLVLEGSADLAGFGNAADNMLIGNGGANSLAGGSGADTLAGWRGDDWLAGGAGSDVYVVSRGDGRDTIADVEGEGRLHFSGDIRRSEVSIQPDGDDLVIVVAGGADGGNGAEVRLLNWATATERVAQLTFCADAPFVLGVDVPNAPPVAADDAAAAQEDGPAVTGNVLANDADPDAGDTLVVVGAADAAGAFGTLQLAADGGFSYAVDNGAPHVQALRAGQQVSDAFTYTIADAQGAQASATLTVTVTGVNDAPRAEPDTAAASEDGVVVAHGHLLANDTDVDAGDTLTVPAGSFSGTYGQLAVAADGSYTYALDNGAAAVQTLAAGQTVQDSFGYSVQDSAAGAGASTLTVTVTGANDAPVLVTPAPDVVVQGADAGGDDDHDYYGGHDYGGYDYGGHGYGGHGYGGHDYGGHDYGHHDHDDHHGGAQTSSPIAIDLPDGMFADIDQGDLLAYSASLVGGAPLPAWLVFDPNGLTFTGTPPQDSGGLSFDIELTATDLSGASASDVFRIAIDDRRGQTCIGTSSHDFLRGTDRNDTLDGGAGNDVITGGAGKDWLIGGAGNDTFCFSLASESGAWAAAMDSIVDFTTGQDQVDLSAIDANTAAPGNQAFTYIGTAAFNASGSTSARAEVRYDPAAGVLYGSTDSDAATEFAVFIGIGLDAGAVGAALVL